MYYILLVSVFRQQNYLILAAAIQIDSVREADPPPVTKCNKASIYYAMIAAFFISLRSLLSFAITLSVCYIQHR